MSRADFSADPEFTEAMNAIIEKRQLELFKAAPLALDDVFKVFHEERPKLRPNDTEGLTELQFQLLKSCEKK